MKDGHFTIDEVIRGTFGRPVDKVALENFKEQYARWKQEGK